MKSWITEIQVVPIKPKNGLVGFVSFVFFDSFFLGSVGVYTRPQGGYRLTYPTRGDFNVFHPINKEVAQEVEQAVISKFEEVTKQYAGYNKTNTG